MKLHRRVLRHHSLERVPRQLRQVLLQDQDQERLQCRRLRLQREQVQRYKARHRELRDQRGDQVHVQVLRERLQN